MKEEWTRDEQREKKTELVVNEKLRPTSPDAKIGMHSQRL